MLLSLQFDYLEHLTKTDPQKEAPEVSNRCPQTSYKILKH